MTAALEEGEWSAARPGRTLRPGKTQYPFYSSLGGPQGGSGRAENLVPTGNFFFFWYKHVFINLSRIRTMFVSTPVVTTLDLS